MSPKQGQGSAKKMPIDINWLRSPDRGGNPDLWREYTIKRGKPVELVNNVIDLDEVCIHIFALCAFI
jgi:hypothetical protein